MNLIQSVDDIDTRREVARCFEILPPIERIFFLLWCCERVNILKRDGVFVTIKNSTGSHMESYLDFWQLTAQWDLDLNLSLPELERRARLFATNPFEKNPNVSIFCER